jgi:hypothetical protein
MPDDPRRRTVHVLLRGAFEEARALGDGYMDPTHFVLAILTAAETPAAAALRECGLDHETLSAHVRRWSAGMDPPLPEATPEELASPVLNPATYQLMGRAEGIAIGLDEPVATAEHVLIAYVWSDSGTLAALDVSRESVLDGLRERGIRVPATPLPPPPRSSGSRVFVPYDALMDVVDALTATLPRDAGLGFNHDGVSRAWVSAFPEIDLQERIDSILEDLGLDAVPQPEG